MAEIVVPTVSGVMDGVRNYAYGAIARVGFNVISGFTGSGLIGGAVAAAVSSAVIRGPSGDAIAAILGFQAAANINPLNAGGGGGGGGSGLVDI